MFRFPAAAVWMSGFLFCFANSLPAQEARHPGEDVDQATAAGPSAIDQIRELIQAADHLEAAGAFDLVREVRSQAESLMVQEAARLAEEQEQFEEVARALHQTQILIQALIVEARQLPADFLIRMIGQHGGELIGSDSASDHDVPSAAILAEGATGSEEIRSLADMAEIEILSRPQVMALDGMLAQIQIGQRVPVVNGFTFTESGSAVPTHSTEDAGISLTITPATISEGRIRLDLMVEQTRFLEDDTPLYTDPVTGEVITSPVKDVMTAQTAFTVPDGRALFFLVNPRPEGADSESTLLLVLRPRVIVNEE